MLDYYVQTGTNTNWVTDDVLIYGQYCGAGSVGYANVTFLQKKAKNCLILNYSVDADFTRTEISFYNEISEDVDLVILADSIGTRHAFIKEGTDLFEYITELEYYPVIDDQWHSFIEHSWRETYVTEWFYDECLQAMYKKYPHFEYWWICKNNALGTTPEEYFEYKFLEHLQERITDADLSNEVCSGAYWEYEYDSACIVDGRKLIAPIMAEEFMGIVRKTFENPEFPVHKRNEWKKNWRKLI